MSGWLDITGSVAAEMIDAAMTADNIVTPTGLPTVDRNIFLWGDRRGMPQGSYAIVGGASNFGKTLFSLHMLKQAAETGQRAGYISLDMKNRDAMARLHQAIATTIPLREWLPSSWNGSNLQDLKDALVKWRLSRDAGDIAIHTDRSRDLASICDKVREGTDAGATFFVVDHLQKVRVDSHRGDVYTTSEIVSETLDDLVDQLNVTILGLSQLNRQASREVDRRPTMFDLHGGTSIESNAAFILMLDHSRYERDRLHRQIIRSYVLFEKNQMGPKGIEVPVVWDTGELTIREGLPDEEHLWPGERKGRRR